MNSRAKSELGTAGEGGRRRRGMLLVGMATALVVAFVGWRGFGGRRADDAARDERDRFVEQIEGISSAEFTTLLVSNGIALHTGGIASAAEISDEVSRLGVCRAVHIKLETASNTVHVTESSITAC